MHDYRSLYITLAKGMGHTLGPESAYLARPDDYRLAVEEATEIAEGRPWVPVRLAAQAILQHIYAGLDGHEAVARVRAAVDDDATKNRLQGHWAWQNDPRQIAFAERLELLAA